MWEDHQEANKAIYYRYSWCNGNSWTGNLCLTYPIGEYSSYPSIISYGSYARVVWQDKRDINWEIYFKKGYSSAPPMNPSSQGKRAEMENEKELANRELLLKVIPNPATKNVLLKINAPGQQDLSLKIYDITGRMVKNIGLKQNTVTINWNRLDDSKTELPDGIYFVRLETKDGVATEKLILTK